MPGSYSLNIYHGDTFHWQFMLWTDSAKTVPADLTGVISKSQIRDRPGGTAIVTLTTAINLPNTITMDLNATESANLPLTNGAWDLQLTYPTGEVITILAGVAYITPDVTDSDTATPTTSTLRRVK